MKKFLIAVVILCGCSDLHDEDNLYNCADRYRVCIQNRGASCMKEASLCRVPYYTTKADWALILANGGQLMAIDAENNSAAFMAGVAGASAARSVSKGR